MFDSNTFTQEMLSNPTKLMKAVIDKMEKSDTTNSISITDPNNGFFMMLAANMAVYSKFSEKVDTVASFMYPQRARNAEQLFHHLSEFDYTKLMASPATLPFLFAMDKNWIVANSVYFDENYNKIQIPSTSFITMGGVVYSMYHPIDILINRNTGSVTAFYNGEKGNKLNSLASNMLVDVQEFTRNGINWFQIIFNMYQFERKSETYTVGSEQGFIKTIPYDDQFYAVKVTTRGPSGEWFELDYSFTQRYYDYKVPTAVLSLLPDQSKLQIEIPQIYLDNGQISQNIRVELYTTKGAVNFSLSAADVNSVQANFDTSSTPFAAPLAQMPSWTIIPTTLEVSGGSNVATYDEMREAIVKQRLSDRVAITTPEIYEAGKKAGFDLTRVKDDLTERMYFAANVLTDSNDLIVPTFAGNILIADDSLKSDPSTILGFTDGSYTILPTTTFTISENSLACVPMTDGEIVTMSQMTTQAMIDELNKGIYVRQPFHITLSTSRKSPQSMIYNLLSPSMVSLNFIGENTHSAPQMSVTSCNITHLENGTGGYRILLGVVRSSNIDDADIGSFNVYFTCITKTGELAYIPATYRATNGDGVDVWEVNLSTSYHITADDFLTVSMRDDTDTLTDVEVYLNQKFTIVTSFDRTYDPTIPTEVRLNNLLPPRYQLSETAMSEQTMVLSLGRNLSSQIYCGVNTNWGDDVYKTANETIYYHTDVPIFQSDEDGLINTRFNTSTQALEVVLLYPKDAVPASTLDIEIKTTQNAVVPASGSKTVIVVDDTTGLIVGMPIRGLNIVPGSVIEGIVSKTLTLSTRNTVAIPSGTKLTVTNYDGLLRTTVNQPAKGVQLSVASTQDLLVGQSVMGFDIPAGAKIASIDSATQFSLTAETTNPLAANSLLTIINKTAKGVVKINKGDVLTDATGKAIIVKGAQNQYMIPAILFDGRLFASENPNDQRIVGTISQRLQNFANQISTIDAGLIEDSNVFYKPARTMGFADFGIGAGKTISLSLELSFEVTVYVDISVYNTQTLLSTMSNSIVATINKGIQRPIISVSEITDDIKNTLGTNISAVEMGDISGVDGLRLISLEGRGATPCIENVLSIDADGTISRSPNIKITYLPKPDTAESSTLSSL